MATPTSADRRRVTALDRGTASLHRTARSWRGLGIALALILAVLIAVGCTPASSAPESSSPAPTSGALAPTGSAPRTAARRHSDLPTVPVAELPRQARETIALIDAGGPFPFDRDGITFQNRESLLPRKPKGYYREYTVITPGSSDRGARRIIAGKGGELYYTDDHYDSFREVLR